MSAILSRPHDGMETFSMLLALCEGNQQGTNGFPSQTASDAGCNVFYDVSLNKQLNKLASFQQFWMLYAHYDITVMQWIDCPISIRNIGITNIKEIALEVIISGLTNILIQA